MRIDGDDVYFETTGIKQYANNGIIGISPDLGISGGYDDCCIAEVWEEKINDSRQLTRDERTELADFMIDLWRKYKDQPPTEGD